MPVKQIVTNCFIYNKTVKLQEKEDKKKISLNLPSDYYIHHMGSLIDPGEMSNTMLHAEKIIELQ